MSLDVYLNGPTTTTTCPHCDGTGKLADSDTLFSHNITHNLGRMAGEAGIYEALWRPEEIGIKTAGQLVGHLEAGLAMLKSDRPRFEKLNPENGWGSYDGLVRFVSLYLGACKDYPDATVRASR